MAKDEVELLEMGARIKELRESHGFKQQWIADQIGVELRTYQFWQAGKSRPEQQHLEKLAALFHVTPKYLLRGETPELLAARTDQLTRMEDQISRLAAEIRLLRAELVTRDAEELARIEGVHRAIQGLQRQQRQ
jgi:transcriptional regulator with XRE-family HTH domain